MVRFISVKCPDCGAALQFEEGRQTAFCSYCGAKILLHNENEHIYRNIDEAGIKQAENDRVYMMKELEMEEKEDRHRRIMTFLWLFITIAFFAVGFYFVQTDGYISGWIIILLGILIGEFGLLVFTENRKKRSKNRYRPGYVKIPDQAVYYENLNFTAARDLLKASGFSNIRVINLGDLRLGIFTKNGSVDSITIDGEPVSPDEWYRQEAPVIISYHGFPGN
ncbi:MAG: zinc ribbon domain-containing protein [Anaerolineaceae bacterium]|nr:zinc ribbon domain-containing protein [Anaerolineaceae bacterium]